MMTPRWIDLRNRAGDAVAREAGDLSGDGASGRRRSGGLPAMAHGEAAIPRQLRQIERGNGHGNWRSVDRRQHKCRGVSDRNTAHCAKPRRPSAITPMCAPAAHPSQVATRRHSARPRSPERATWRCPRPSQPATSCAGNVILCPDPAVAGDLAALANHRGRQRPAPPMSPFVPPTVVARRTLAAIALAPATVAGAAKSSATGQGRWLRRSRQRSALPRRR